MERITETVENVVAEMRVMHGEIQTMQSEIKGLQTENRRILDILQRRDE